MTKYYIKISDEEPLPTDESIWFTLEAVENGEDQFWIIRENEYNQLKDRVDEAVDQFTESPDLIEAVQTVINSQGFEPLTCVQSKKVVDEDDDSLSYDYDKIKDMDDDLSELGNEVSSMNTSLNQKLGFSDLLDTVDLNSSYPVKSFAIATAIDQKPSYQDMITLANTKASIYHTHETWKYKKLNNYSELWYNSDLKLCYFTYYRANVSFTKGATSTWDLGTVAGFIPHVACRLNTTHPEISARLTSDGNLLVYSTITGKMTLSCGGMYFYR